MQINLFICLFIFWLPNRCYQNAVGLAMELDFTDTDS